MTLISAIVGATVTVANGLNTATMITSALMSTFFMGGLNGHTQITQDYSNNLFENNKQQVLERFQNLTLTAEEKQNALPLLTFIDHISKVKIEDLEKEYDVDGNASIENSKIILFSEIHDNGEVLSANYRMLSHLAKPGDVILFEGRETHIPVFERAFDKVMNAVYPSLLDANQTATQMAFLKNYSSHLHSDNFPYAGTEGTGWDLLIPKTEGAWQIGAFLSRSVYDIMIDSNNNISKRNIMLKAIFEKLKCRRVFVIAGASHLPSQYTYKTNSAIRAALDETKQFLEPYPYAILTLKNLDNRGGFIEKLKGLHHTMGMLVSGMVALMTGTIHALRYLPKKGGLGAGAVLGAFAAYLWVSQGVQDQTGQNGSLNHLDNYCQ